MTFVPQPDQVEASAPRGKNIIIEIIKWALFLAVLVFVIRALARQFAQIDFHNVHFQPLMIAGAIACMMLVPIAQLISYRILLSAYLHSPPWRALAAAIWVPILGKYVPGKVASVVGIVYILKKFQIPIAIAFSVVLVLDGMMAVSGLMLGAPLLLSGPVKHLLPQGWILAAMIVLAGLVCLHPKVFGWVTNFVLKKMKHPPLDHMPDLTHYIVPVICVFSQWTLAGFSLWFVAKSVTAVPMSQIPIFISIAGLAYTISYLALFAPGGIGVREAIFLTTLQQVVGLGSYAAIVVVGIRLVQLFVELICVMIGLIILKFFAQEPAGFLASSTTR
ncbi:MAG TPA: lysylphosphatidylglycerol synthase domain-containing protein [Tepidisphaeraceae bacterium]|nr:lysylphosphatidylglycerol synthase domain-containing protein [Tepidisphaeraceae bacterium]